MKTGRHKTSTDIFDVVRYFLVTQISELPGTRETHLQLHKNLQCVKN